MPRALRPIGHETRLSVVDHLDELRSRLIVCGVVVLIAFAAWLLKRLAQGEGAAVKPAEIAAAA